MAIEETPAFTLTSNSDVVLQVLFMPSERLVSCSRDKTIKIWNVKDGKELFQLIGHTYTVFSIVTLPNGLFASGSADNTITIWDLEERKEMHTIKAHSGSVLSLRVLKNGNFASYSLDDTIKIWRKYGGDEPLLTMKGHGNVDFGFQLFGVLSNDYLVTCSLHKNDEEECILRMWDPNEPSPIKSVQTGSQDARSMFVLSNDQITLGFKSGSIKIIDLIDDALSKSIERAHDVWVFSLAQLSNGNLISSGKDDSLWTIKVWNMLDLSLLQTIKTGHSDSIRSFTISTDERLLATGSYDNTIKLWSISNKATLMRHDE